METEPAEARTLRLGVATLSAQNAALRRELDRLLTRGRPVEEGADAPARGGQDRSAGATAPRLAERIGAILESVRTGERPAGDLVDLLREDPGALAALEEAYLAGGAEDRLLLMPAILSGGSPQAREFLIGQIREESDPEVRDALVRQAAGFATPLHAEELKATFLEAAEGAGDAETRGAALRGLRYAKGDDVEELLRSSLAEGPEEIRLAAIEGLVSRPGMHDELERLLEREASPRVREIGECRLLLTKPTRERKRSATRPPSGR